MRQARTAPRRKALLVLLALPARLGRNLSRNLRRVPPRRWLLVLALGLLPLLADSCFRYPRTASAPPGLYLLTSRSLPSLQRGSWVVACLPEAVAELGRRRGYLGAGRCDGSSEVLKQIAALPGDVVHLAPQGIRVNGVALPGTARRRTDAAGRPVPALRPGRYTVPPGSVWLVSAHHPRSWDSRYYGAVPLAGVRAAARRLWPPPAVTR